MPLFSPIKKKTRKPVINEAIGRRNAMLTDIYNYQQNNPESKNQFPNLKKGKKKRGSSS